MVHLFLPFCCFGVSFSMVSIGNAGNSLRLAAVVPLPSLRWRHRVYRAVSLLALLLFALIPVLNILCLQMTEQSWLCFKFSSSPTLSHGQTQWDLWGWAERGEEGETRKGGLPGNRTDLSDARWSLAAMHRSSSRTPHSWPLSGRPPQLWALRHPSLSSWAASDSLQYYSQPTLRYWPLRFSM